MDLKELKKQLYKPESEFEERVKSPSEEWPQEKKEEELEPQQWDPIKREPTRLEKMIVWFTEERKKQIKKGFYITGVFLVLLAIGMTWYGLTSFNKDDVILEFNGPEKADSGEEITYRVKYINDTRVELQDIKLIFHYPSDSVSLSRSSVETFDMPDLPAGKTYEADLPCRIVGNRGDRKEVVIELSYSPAKISSRFSHQAKFTTEIKNVPLVLNFDLPSELASGQNFEFGLKITNQSEVAFDSLRLETEYPEGFEFKSANPEALENDAMWEIDNLKAGEEKEITIKGIIKGEAGESKSFKAQLGFMQDGYFEAYADAADSSRISVSPLYITQTVNRSREYIANAGDTLEFLIKYKNTTGTTIKNAIITAHLEGEALDLTSINPNDGSYDGETNTMIWKASNLSELEYLEPLEEGEFSFGIDIKENLPISDFSDTNFSVKNVVKIDSTEAPLEDIEISFTDSLIVKIGTEVTLQTKGFYNDDTIPNSGPIPPKVGETTTYTIKWRLINTSNNLTNTKVKAFLPPHVKWLARVVPSNSDITYTPQTGQVIWNVGTLSAATGILSPVKEVAFQISITPSLAYLGNTVELIGQSTITGQDAFTGLELTNSDKPIDTDLPDDPVINRDGGIVIQ